MQTERYQTVMQELEQTISLMHDALQAARETRYQLRYNYLKSYEHQYDYLYKRSYPSDYQENAIFIEVVERDSDEYPNYNWHFRRYVVKDGQAQELIKLQPVEFENWLELMAEHGDWLVDLTKSGIEKRNVIAMEIMDEIFAEDNKS